jgi:tRNA (guanine37-N1)-methyltransferase
MTFGVEMCYIVTPLPKQRRIAQSLIDHWLTGYGRTYNQRRGEALGKITMADDLGGVLAGLKAAGDPFVVGTSSRARNKPVLGHRQLYNLLCGEERPGLLLFGTGWGLTDETLTVCDSMLEPIGGTTDYNHLSLRVAVGITLDRIFGQRGGKNERDD